MPGLMTLTVKAIRDLLVSNGTMTKEGRLNKEMAAKPGWTVRDVESVLQNHRRGILGNLNGLGVYVDSGIGDCLGHLLDIDHSRQILQICIACDDFSLLVFCRRIHDRIGHC